MKCIIIEGIDQIGKSEFIKRLMSYLIKSGKIPLEIHFSNYFVEQLGHIFYYSKFFKILKSLPSDYIYVCNRSHIGEFVYGQLYRNYSENLANYVFELERDNLDFLLNCCLIVLLPANSVLNEFINIRKDNYALSQNQLNLIIKEIELFKKAYSLSWIPHKFLYYIKNLNDNFEFLEKLAEKFAKYVDKNI